MAETKEANQPIFSDLAGDEIETGDLEVTSVESMCPRCEDNGDTRLLFTKIPFFREVILSSFSCVHCGYRNNELNSAAPIQDNGVQFTFQMKNRSDLQRNIVRSEHCSIVIPDLEFEIPTTSTGRGIFTTVEGLLRRSFEDIGRDQPVRRITDPEIAQQIDNFLEKAHRVTGLTEDENASPSCTIIFRDISGNSFVENPHAPYPDPRLRVDHFVRSKEMSEAIGYREPEVDDKQLDAIPEEHGGLDLKNEVLSIPSNCPAKGCNEICQANFKTVSIPYFKDVLIMATVCDKCGYKTNEVKSGQGFEEKGVRHELFLDASKWDHQIDMARDVLKSETCTISIENM